MHQDHPMRTTRLKHTITALLLIFSFIACKDDTIQEPAGGYTYIQPDQLNDGWEVASLADVGMDNETITDLTNRILNGDFRGIHSMLIVKDGVLVHEAYFEGYGRNDLQTIFSITKSVTSCLIGIAIDQGLIRGVGDTVLSYFPEYSGGITDPQKQNIRLQHLLTLTSGLEWDEKTFPYSDSRNSETQMIATSDWMRFVLERPLRDEPGTTWVYNTGSVHLLSGIIRRASSASIHTNGTKTPRAIPAPAARFRASA